MSQETKKTPLWRRTKPLIGKYKNETGECKTRKMTDEERVKYNSFTFNGKTIKL